MGTGNAVNVIRVGKNKMTARELIKIKDIEISFQTINESDFISLTDIARYKDKNRTNYIIQNWMRTRSTIEFIGLWEKINNPNFKGVEFDAFKSEAGSNSFSLTPQKWIETTDAIGLISKSGRYGGGVYAHKDIAFEFASWISAEFKLYLIKEFERLKNAEYVAGKLEWNARRMLSKTNYRIHTDAIKAHLPKNLTEKQINITYANEADVLNVALFGLTATEWRAKNKGKKGNLRDDATIRQLVVLTNIESYNAEMIRRGLDQHTRLKQLNIAAIALLKSLMSNDLRQLKDENIK